jgi:hypothetical protein
LLFKSFSLREQVKLEVRMEATGATNTPDLNEPGANMNQSPTFGVITSREATGRCRDRRGWSSDR